jgi:hypothetical protein
VVLNVPRLQNEMRFKILLIFLKKSFSRKKIMISLSTTAMYATCVLILKLHKNGKQNIDIFRTFSAAQEEDWKKTHSDNQGGSKEGKGITEWCVKCKNSSMYHVLCFKLLLKMI